MSRVYTSIATPEARTQLDCLLANTGNPKAYQSTMTELGRLLGECVFSKLSPKLSSKLSHVKEGANSDNANNVSTNNNWANSNKSSSDRSNSNLANSKDTIVVSTAEDVDFLQHGVSTALHAHKITTKLAVFWNHHYQLPSKTSVAPILHSFIEPDFEDIKNVIIVKSVISGSCVVRTNLIAMLDKMTHIEKIFIVSPVAHKESKDKLRKAFPKEIANKFEFVFFAEDDVKNAKGEVVPGIGGQIYQLLGLSNQPVLIGYIPKLVEDLTFSNLQCS